MPTRPFRGLPASLPALRLGAALTALALTLAGCARWSTGYAALPLQQAWFEGQRVQYISTDVNDAAMAQALGINHAPRLGDALPEEPRRPGQRSALERVYKFVAKQQASVFASVPRPVGPSSQDGSYSPLWRIVEVRWRDGRTVRLLDSEEAVLAAEEQGEVSLTMTPIIINCPVLRTERGGALPALR